MSGGLVEIGFVGEDHIEVGPVVEGRIAVSLCPLFQLCHTWPSSAQHIQGPLVTYPGPCNSIVRSPVDGVETAGTKGVLPMFPAAAAGKLLGGGMRKYCSTVLTK